MSFYIKWKQNYITKLQIAWLNKKINKIAKLDSMITHILMPWFETFNSKHKTKSTERRKTSFPKETVENADLDKAVLNKMIT